jgi:hypothetical protein
MTPTAKRALIIGGVAAGAVAIIAVTATVASAKTSPLPAPPPGPPPPGPPKPEVVTYRDVAITIAQVEGGTFRSSWTLDSSAYDRTGKTRDSVLDLAKKAIDDMMVVKPSVPPPVNIAFSARGDDGVLQLRVGDSLDYTPYNAAPWNLPSKDQTKPALAMSVLGPLSQQGSHFVALKPGSVDLTGSYQDTMNDVSWTRIVQLTVHVVPQQTSA